MKKTTAFNDDSLSLNRRAFIRRGAAAAGTIAATGLFSGAAFAADSADKNEAPGSPAPALPERVKIGFIGVGERGRTNLKAFLQASAGAPAICDVSAKACELAMQDINEYYHCSFVKEKFPGCAVSSDFRELLARPEVQAVAISAPDHWHAPMAMAALAAGKHVYLEKPIGAGAAECSALRDAALRCGAVFVQGTELRCLRHVRFGCELVLNGRIGALREIKIAVAPGRKGGNPAPEQVPAGFNYDLWLGPAQWRPYSALRCKEWRNIGDYAPGGSMTNMGVDWFEIALLAMGVSGEAKQPAEIEGTASWPDEGLFDAPLGWEIRYAYPDNVRVTFTDSAKNREGISFEGAEGWINLTREGISAGPRALLTSAIRPNDIRLPVVDNPYRDFLDQIKSGVTDAACADLACQSAVAPLLGLIAARTGRKLTWNAASGQFSADDSANRHLTRVLRSPWRI